MGEVLKIDVCDWVECVLVFWVNMVVYLLF